MKHKNRVYYTLIAIIFLVSTALKFYTDFENPLLKYVLGTLEYLSIGVLIIFVLHLKDQVDSLKKTSHEKNSFLLKITLQIRNHMNNILGTMSILEGSKLAEEQTTLIELMRSSGDSLLLTLNDIKDYEDLTSHNIKLECKNFNLRESVEECINLVSFKAFEKGIDIFVEINQEVPENFVGDSHRLKQVIINLINNSIAYTEFGNILLEISHNKIDQNNIGLEFSIKDTGIGFDEMMKYKLFEPFDDHIKSSSNKNETGLGLTICKELIKLMDGTITLESPDDSGTQCYFSIKLQLAKS